MSPRIYVPALALVFALGWVGIWLHQRDVRNRELGAAQARIERDSALVTSLRDSLTDARQRTTAGIAKVDTVVKGFDRWRTQVRVIPGVPDTVKVPVRFVESADSLRRLSLPGSRARGFWLRSNGLVANRLDPPP